MLAFILPLKPKSQSKNWDKDCDLLEATIQSLLHQQSNNYKIYVVFSDDPGLAIHSDKIIFIYFPFPFCSYTDIAEAKEILPRFNNDIVMLERRWDKSRKIFYGCKVAKEDGCSYLMSVDADDLVSNKLVTYLGRRIEEKDLPGFYIDKGYLYRSGRKRLIKINRGMQNFNGSTHIIKSDFIKIPDFDKGKWMDYNLFTSHGWIVYRLREELGINLEAIPFPAIIYVAHGGNISNVSQVTLKDKIKEFIKFIIKGQSLTPSIKKEFSIGMRHVNKIIPG